MSKHTPGPWVIFLADADGSNDVLPAGRLGCIARDIKNDADAYLIVAAPAMLAALKMICRTQGRLSAMEWQDILNLVAIAEHSPTDRTTTLRDG